MQEGVVMAAFGQKYVDLAYQAAKSLLQHNPGLEVDLFTDAERNQGPFSRIHVLDAVWIRSKVDAMLQSRFDKTLFLDVDLYVLADLGDVFEVLDKFDIAATHDQYRNSIHARRVYRKRMENAFPQINSGVFGFRQSEKVTNFLQEWKQEIKIQGIGKDQPSLRELFWNKDLRLSVLPAEYNLWDLSLIDQMKPALHTAPRILHSDIFRDFPEPPSGSDVLIHYLGKARAHKLGLLLAADETLAQRTGRPALLPTRKQRNASRQLYALARTSRFRRTVIKVLKEVLLPVGARHENTPKS
jgi:lipopolysaccharide biosynthesis glycosyltransferase